MTIWRIHLKTAAQSGIDQRQLCLDKGIVGVGWPITYQTTSVTWEDYMEIAEEDYGGSSWRSALKTMKNRIQIDDIIWTRDWSGNYYLGRIISDWYYDTSEECKNADMVNVRKCEWHKIGTEEAVPGKIVSCFRAPRTVQIIDDDTVSLFSQVVYNKYVHNNFYDIESIVGQDIFSLLSTDDCEDALAIYLQVEHEYLVIPSSCKDDTMTYEFELKNRLTGKTAVAQVKSGWTPLNIDDYQNLETDVFLFATSGQYHGSPKTNVTIIDLK